MADPVELTWWLVGARSSSRSRRPRVAATGRVRREARYYAALVVAALAGPALAAGGEAPRGPGFADLPGWREDDHSVALRAFRSTCRRSGKACRTARALPANDPDEARRFFESRFEPVEISSAGFLTGYFEPEMAGSLRREGRYRVPLLGPPPGLVPRPAGAAPRGWPDGLSAARRTGRGFAPLPDRAAIEGGALGESAPPVVYLADPVDAFTIHVQGSARIRLEDGRVVRVGFAGRNGHPYTAIAKVLAEAEGIAPAELTADRLWAWLKAHPDRAPALMQANRSFIFFRRLEARAGDGPVGAAGVPLLAGRSLAVDPRAWAYGTPVWLAGDLPRPGGGSEPLNRLTIAQDTGAAIVGAARGDLFLGSGERAGAEASLLRQRVRWIVLRPRPAPRRPARR